MMFSVSWSSYSKIYQIQAYNHLIVNHRYNFVDPVNNQLHSHKIESAWREGKLKFKEMNGVDRRYIKNYLDEFIWRHNNGLTRQTAYDAILQGKAKYFRAVMTVLQFVQLIDKGVVEVNENWLHLISFEDYSNKSQEPEQED